MALMESFQLSSVTAMIYAATMVVEREIPAMLWTREILLRPKLLAKFFHETSQA